MSALPQQRVFNYPNRLARQNRQPQGVADFVLIDPYKFLEYENTARLFDKLPTGLPMAKDKSESHNRYYQKWQVNDFSHFTPNHKKFIHCLVFDLDPTDNPCNFMAWSDHGLPPPNIIISNPSKANSCQYIYLLEYPVYTSKTHIKQWLDDIYACMRDLLNADKFFNRTRSKNPFSPLHDTYVSGANPYNLSELSDKCDLPLYQALKRSYQYTLELTKPTIQKPQATLLEPQNDPNIYKGRNDETFEKVRHIGYANAKQPQTDLYNLLLNACIQYQKRFDQPLENRECEYIATSITKFCIERFGQGDFVKTGQFSEQAKQRFSNHQRNRVNKGRWKPRGYREKRQQAEIMLKDGVKQVDICRKLNIAKSTLHLWKKTFKIKYL